MPRDCALPCNPIPTRFCSLSAGHTRRPHDASTRSTASSGPPFMESMRGLLHKTSVQQAQEQRSMSKGLPSRAGRKRSLSEIGSRLYSPPKSELQGAIQFQRTVSLPHGPARLSVSQITDSSGGHGIGEYSQRHQLGATPTSTQDPVLDLSHQAYGLPPQVVQNLAMLGIKEIYPWQKACLQGPNLLSGQKNLVYSAPTGGGKSLVADCRRPWKAQIKCVSAANYFSAYVETN